MTGGVESACVAARSKPPSITAGSRCGKRPISYRCTPRVAGHARQRRSNLTTRRHRPRTLRRWITGGSAAVVTGASRGIGRAIAVDLAQAGLRRESPPCAIPAAGQGSGRRKSGRRRDRSPAPSALDVTDPSSIDRPAPTCGLLVNNAGIEPRLPAARAHAGRRTGATCSTTNVFGLVEVTRRAVPLLRANGGGVVCYGHVVVDPRARAVLARRVPRVEGRGRARSNDTLRVELAPFGIRVVEIMPGPVESDMLYASERIAEAVQFDEYRAMAERRVRSRMQVTDQVHAGARRRRGRDPRRDPRRRRPDAIRLRADVDRRDRDVATASSDEQIFTAITGQG